MISKCFVKKSIKNLNKVKIIFLYNLYLISSNLFVGTPEKFITISHLDCSAKYIETELQKGSAT